MRERVAQAKREAEREAERKKQNELADAWQRKKAYYDSDTLDSVIYTALLDQELYAIPWKSLSTTMIRRFRLAAEAIIATLPDPDEDA